MNIINSNKKEENDWLLLNSLLLLQHHPHKNITDKTIGASKKVQLDR